MSQTTKQIRANSGREKEILNYKKLQLQNMKVEIDFLEFEARANKASFEKMDYYLKCRAISEQYNKAVEEDTAKQAAAEPADRQPDPKVLEDQEVISSNENLIEANV